MKKVIAVIAVILLAVMLAGCTTSTSFGPCVGVDDSDRNPTLHYKLSVWNVILAVIFVETIVVPVVVVLDNTYCPIGKK